MAGHKKPSGLGAGAAEVLYGILTHEHVELTNISMFLARVCSTDQLLWLVTPSRCQPRPRAGPVHNAGVHGVTAGEFARGRAAGPASKLRGIDRGGGQIEDGTADGDLWAIHTVRFFEILKAIGKLSSVIIPVELGPTQENSSQVEPSWITWNVTFISMIES
jgi:hypothetical protein